MFNSIRGTLTGKFPQRIFIENGGIEWDICVPDSNIDCLPALGSEVKIFTWLQHTDAFMNLFGFSSAEERSLFSALLKVDGVGPKGAIKIMSNVSSEKLTAILENADVALLEKIPGVGKKTAAKMILALKGKLTFAEDEKTIRARKDSRFSDVIASLAEMGYEKNIAEQKVLQLADLLSADQSFSSKPQKEQEDIIFRRVIVELA